VPVPTRRHADKWRCSSAYSETLYYVNVCEKLYAASHPEIVSLVHTTCKSGWIQNRSRSSGEEKLHCFCMESHSSGPWSSHYTSNTRFSWYLIR